MDEYRRSIMKTFLEAYRQVLLKENTISLTNYKVKYSVEDKKGQQAKLAYKKVQDYITNGSQGNLDLNGTPIPQLPADLKVGGSLYLNNTSITQLPAGLKVEGDLNLVRTPITQLPADLEVGGDLFLSRTPIAKKYTTDQLKQMLPGVKGDISFN